MSPALYVHDCDRGDHCFETACLGKEHRVSPDATARAYGESATALGPLQTVVSDCYGERMMTADSGLGFRAVKASLAT